MLFSRVPFALALATLAISMPLTASAEWGAWSSKITGELPPWEATFTGTPKPFDGEKWYQGFLEKGQAAREANAQRLQQEWEQSERARAQALANSYGNTEGARRERLAAFKNDEINRVEKAVQQAKILIVGDPRYPELRPISEHELASALKLSGDTLPKNVRSIEQARAYIAGNLDLTSEEISRARIRLQTDSSYFPDAKQIVNGRGLPGFRVAEAAIAARPSSVGKRAMVDLVDGIARFGTSPQAQLFRAKSWRAAQFLNKLNGRQLATYTAFATLLAAVTGAGAAELASDIPSKADNVVEELNESDKSWVSKAGGISK